MKPNKYTKMVRDSSLKELAASEGRMLAAAVEREASVNRMIAEIEASGKEPEQQIKDELHKMRAIAESMKREADGIRYAASVLAGWIKPEKPPEEKPPELRLEDVIATLQEAKAGDDLLGEIGVLWAQHNFVGIEMAVMRRSWPFEVSRYIEAVISAVRAHMSRVMSREQSADRGSRPVTEASVDALADETPPGRKPAYDFERAIISAMPTPDNLTKLPR